LGSYWQIQLSLPLRPANEAIRLNPHDATAFNNRGVAYANKRDFDRAIADYNEPFDSIPITLSLFAIGHARSLGIQASGNADAKAREHYVDIVKARRLDASSC
jgi:tetratricopeptide (TPR) repeat protein